MKTELLARTKPPLWSHWFLGVYSLLTAVAGLRLIVGYYRGDLFGGLAADRQSLAALWGGLTALVWSLCLAIAAAHPQKHWLFELCSLMLVAVFAVVLSIAPGTAASVVLTGMLVAGGVAIAGLTSLLFQAYRYEDAVRLATATGTLAEELSKAETNRGESLSEISRRSDLLLICLRHSGCAYCQETLADLAQLLPTLHRGNITTVVVHMGTLSHGDRMLARHGLESVAHVSDPARHLYAALGLPLGTLGQVAGRKVVWRAVVERVYFRFSQQPIVGNIFQLGGGFLLRNDAIVGAWTTQSAADRLDICRVIGAESPIRRELEARGRLRPEG